MSEEVTLTAYNVKTKEIISHKTSPKVICGGDFESEVSFN